MSEIPFSEEKRLEMVEFLMHVARHRFPKSTEQELTDYELWLNTRNDIHLQNLLLMAG